MKNVNVQICTWLNDAPFAYSMTYDEGTVDCLANAFPIHQQFSFPGHVDVVAGQLGRQRNAYCSSLNDYVHMGVEELKFLVDHGWGVGNHSWSHYVHPIQPGLNLWREVVWSKYRLEDMLNIPIRIFTIPNDKHNYEPVLDLVKQHYLACAYIDGAPNRENFDLYKIGNFMVASGNISREYDWPEMLLTPNLSLDFLKGSWLYETTHLVMWNVPQDKKCITPEDLTRRFRRLLEISGGNLWAATPDRVIDYVLLRRNLSVKILEQTENGIRFELLGSWPIGVISSELTFRVRHPRFTSTPQVNFLSDRLPGARHEQKVVGPIPDRSDWLITLNAFPGRIIEITCS